MLSDLETKEYVVKGHKMASHKANIVYTLLGDNFYYQAYIKDSIRQARLFNPELPIYVIMKNESFPEMSAFQNDKNLKLVNYNDVLQSTLMAEFHKVFFLKENWIPIDGNKQFMSLTMERIFVLCSYVEMENLTDIFHIENDNMIYTNLNDQLEMMRICNIGIGIPRITMEHAALSFAYFRNSSFLMNFSHFFLAFYKKGPERLKSANDMIFASIYLKENKNVMGCKVVVLPSWFLNPHELDDFCSSTKQFLIYDAASIGQKFGGTHLSPGISFVDENRPFVQLKNATLEWRNCSSVNASCPFLDNFKVINIHVHSKKLAAFSSLVI
jgi:hypothetical protein